MHVICDFDGTVTLQDTTDVVLERLARPEWRELEEAWLGNQISAAECMRRQIALIEASPEELHEVLDQAPLDPGFLDFVAWCDARSIPLAIVSDGVDGFVFRILARHRLERLPVIANRLRVGQSWTLEQPWAREGCAAGSGVCKCHAAKLQKPARARRPMVFVGDGRSDFCVSARADILFAKGALAEYAQSRAQPFHPFETFHDVRTVLSRLISETDVPAATGVSANHS
jgi:2,3-diketo-5-methylthio-1-phosphopentane phosphatase